MGGDAAALERVIDVMPQNHGDPAGAFRVVGVARDVAYDGFGEQGTQRVIRYQDGADPRAGRWDVYLPLARFPVSAISIAAATSGDPSAPIDAVRRSIAEVAPGSAVHWTGTMADEISSKYAPCTLLRRTDHRILGKCVAADERRAVRTAVAHGGGADR